MLKNLVYFVETSAAEPEYAMMHALSANLELPEMHQYSPQSAYLVIPPPLRPLSPISPQVPPIPSQLPQPPAPQPQAPSCFIKPCCKETKGVIPGCPENAD